MVPDNIFDSLPGDTSREVFEDVLRAPNVRIERIVSHGHSSPETGWYDQSESEWVIVLQGSASILFDNGTETILNQGDYLNIPAHCKHKVLWTDKRGPTLWLAVFYS